ncbi:hypothetical protein ODS41_00250 [Pyrobaculum sp. 3827-6]|uniref:hypothetical protein n=1 Tax=Pyrobaculum sp. 3827-6 TaxID=2983604 RepID=UPI0021D99D5A|nr:hypothetical protein [Pyrobaculum sp. 3827-6]MCU7786364.1 hypothetical protein [Pyrobaculum sp. 3827-6]
MQSVRGLAVDLSKRAANSLEDVGRAARLFVGGRGVSTYYFWRFGATWPIPCLGIIRSSSRRGLLLGLASLCRGGPPRFSGRR